MRPSFDVGYERPEGKPIPGYDQDPNKKVVVTYSSINGNGFGGYGEVVMGTKGAIVLDREKELMLYKDADVASRSASRRTRAATASIRKPAAVTPRPALPKPLPKGRSVAATPRKSSTGRGAFAIKTKTTNHAAIPKIAMADAVIALTTNVAMAQAARGEAGYVKFKESWYDRDSDDTPDGSNVAEELKRLEKWKIV